MVSKKINLVLIQICVLLAFPVSHFYFTVFPPNISIKLYLVLFYICFILIERDFYALIENIFTITVIKHT